MANLITGKNDLKTLFPNLSNEWVKSDNGLKPENVTCGSNEKVLWKCSVCGNEWSNTVSERTRYSGCPYCKGRYIKYGFNDFYTWCINNNESLLEEWDATKNIGLDSKSLFYHSTKKVWWKCSVCGYQWNASIGKRVDGNCCPACSNNKLIVGFNDLLTWCKSNNHTLLDEWVSSKNGNMNDYSRFSSKKVYWKCSKCDFEWITTIGNRTRLNSGCPSCAGVILVKGVNDLQSWCQNNNLNNLLLEWNYEKNNYKPCDISRGNNEKVWWKCSICGHEWNASVSSRTSRKGGCPKCSTKGTSFPEQVVFFYLNKMYEGALNRYQINGIEFDVYLPKEKIAIEYDGYYWHNNEHSFDKDNFKDEYCKNNSIRLIRIREKGLSRTKLAETINCESKNIVDIELMIRNLFHLLGNPINININDDYQNIISSHHKNMENNSLANTFPQIAAEWDCEKNSLTPEQVSWGSSVRAWWICPKGHSWISTVNARTNTNRQCPYCDGKKVQKGFNDLASLFPQLSEEWNYEMNLNDETCPNTPQEVTSKSNKTVWWKCRNCGASWNMRVNKRTINGRGCPECAKKYGKGFSKKVRNLDTNEEYISASEASKISGINVTSIRQCCTGKRKTAGGFRWEYSTE